MNFESVDIDAVLRDSLRLNIIASTLNHIRIISKFKKISFLFKLNKHKANETRQEKMNTLIDNKKTWAWLIV